MTMRGNVILQFSAATFAIIGIVSVALGITLARSITDYLLRSHILVYPELVRLVTAGTPDLKDIFQPSYQAKPGDKYESVLRHFLTLGGVFRVKVWSRDSVVVWSDDTGLIGKRFPDDDELQVALTGQEMYEIGTAEEAENIDEANKGITLQVYTPVKDGTEVVGAIELYEANRELFSQIERNITFVWFAVVAAGVVLYLTLFAIFYQAYRTQQRTRRQLMETQDVTIFALAYQAELRDQETGKHLERTSIYVRVLAEELATLKPLRTYLTTLYVADLVKSAPLHDIGKVGVPDSVLQKPGRLSPDEMAAMRRHSELGAQVLNKAAEKLGFQSFLSIAVQLAMSHHERWDGTGYPQRLAAEAIPLSARIMALADVYDALRSRRVYKEAYSHDECVRIIGEERGSHFDPQVADAFSRRSSEFRRISEELSD